MTVTLIIIAITVVISLIANSNPELKRKLLFNAYDINHNNEHYRWLTHGFVHGDFMHLAVNMYVLYAFGNNVERYFNQEFEGRGLVYFLILYLVGIIVSSSSAYMKHKDNPNYNSLGASGAVASVLFAFIIFNPTSPLYFLFLPGVGIPAFILGILYLWYEHYMGQRKRTNIAHDAHFWGAVFGVVFVAVLAPDTFIGFFTAVKGYVQSFIS